MKEYDTEVKCRDFFIARRWHGEVVCPHCGNKGQKTISQIKRGAYEGGFKCFACRRRFTARTNTFMGDSALPYSKWLMAIFLITSHKKGISSLQLAKDIGITQKSAWFIIQRVGNLVGCYDIKLNGVVEVDETYVGGKEHNKHKDRRT
jgi:transposase-like protein